MSEADDRERQTSPPSLDYERADGDPAVALGAALAGVASVVASVVQFALICGSPRLLFFHASDAAPPVGSFTRFDRLCFLVPSLLAIGLGLFALRLRKYSNGGAIGLALAVLALLLVSRVGFSK